MSAYVSRRTFLKSGSAMLGATAVAGAMPFTGQAAETQTAPQAKVYFSREISPDAMLRLYGRINQDIGGKIALKVHTGEPHGPNILPPAWIKNIQEHIPNSSIVECNVLYDSPRQTTEGHRQTLKTNGWTFSEVDIMDAEGDASLPIPGGQQLSEIRVGKHLLNYDSMIVLTHFKGHALAGFGGSLKNIAIGCSSPQGGKLQIHHPLTEKGWELGPAMLQRMVEGGCGITNHFGKRIVYLNVLRNMSVDCDCAGTHAAAPTAPDLGILASTDILAIDQASIDMVFRLPTAQNQDLIERITSRTGLCQLEYMRLLGMGNSDYELIAL